MILTVVTVVAIFTMVHTVDVFNMILTVVTVIAIVTMDHIFDVFNMIRTVVPLTKNHTIHVVNMIT